MLLRGMLWCDSELTGVDVCEVLMCSVAVKVGWFDSELSVDPWCC